MAYISDQYSEQFGSLNSYSPALMPAHVAGDVLLAILTQDNGSGTQTAAGWTEVGTQAKVQAQRTVVFTKVAASSNESITVASSTSNAANISVMTCKGVDVSDIVNGEARNDSGTTATPASPALTTDEDNCLLIYAWGYDGTGALIVDPNELVNITKDDQNCQLITGWRNQYAAGSVPIITAICEINSEGGTAIVIALNDDGTNQKAPDVTTYNMFRRYGAWGQILNNSNTLLTGKNMGGTAITAINGTPIATGNPISVASFTDTGSGYGQTTRFTFSAAPGAGLKAIYGSWEAIPSTDFRNKIVSLQWSEFAITTPALELVGPQGPMIGFQDSNNNWAVFQLSPSAGMLATTSYVTFIAVDRQTPHASGGTIDWSDITKLIYCHERGGSIASQHGMIIKDLCLHENTIVTGGSNKAPASPAALKRAMEGWGQFNLTPAQGPKQVQNKSGYQVGDGTRQTHHDSSIVSYDLPQPYTKALATRFWQVPALSTEYRVKASATDYVGLAASLLATTTKQDFIIDPASSTDAEYNFSGAALSGWVVTGKAGIDFEGTTFNGCYEINLNDAGLISCIVANALSTSAIITGDVSKIVGSSFTSFGTGHAIQATDPGTYDFAGNTFEGYGADGTTDAAFYNNSGGLVTLELPSGGQAPTVRNGAGATTVINLPVDYQSVTITGAVAGSRLQIYDLTSDTELYNGTPTFPYVWQDSTPYVDDREIRVRVAYVDGDEAKGFIEANIGTSTEISPFLGFNVTQVDDVVYNTNAIVGSTVLDISINDGLMLINVDAGAVTWQQIYAYDMYWLFTSTGIQDFGQSVVARDIANYSIYNLKIKNVTSPTEPLVISGGFGVSGVTGDSIDLIDTSGGSVFLAPDHVVPYAVGSGVTPSDILEIRDGLALESTSEEILSNTDATQAKVDLL